MVNGVVIPLTVMPVPVADICEIFRSAVPVLVMLTDWDLDWPSIRLPKLMLAGETLMAGWTPVPVMAKPGAVPGASLAIPTVPPRSPVDAGANVTFNWADWPAARVAGAAMPDSVYAAPEANTLEMCTTPWPVFVTVALRTLLVPTDTLPKVSVEGFRVRWPTGALVAVPESAIVFGEDGSLLVTVMLPVSLPAALGA